MFHRILLESRVSIDGIIQSIIYSSCEGRKKFMFGDFEVHRYWSPLSFNIIVSDAIQIEKINMGRKESLPTR